MTTPLTRELLVIIPAWNEEANLPGVLDELRGRDFYVTTKLDGTSNAINAILSAENQAAFRSAMADIATVARTIAARRDTIDAGITQAGRTLDNTAKATVQLEAVVARIGRSADAVEKMGTEVARTSLSAGKAVDAVGADVNRFSTETLPELERLLGELGALSTSLRLLSEQTTRDPRGLIFGRTPVPDGPGEKGGAP